MGTRELAMNVSFAGKVVFVTGAASGLGRACALEFARCGAKLFLLDVNEAGLAQTKTAAEALGAQCVTHTADVSRKSNCETAVAAAVAHFKRLDALCNVAGIVAIQRVSEVTEAQWERMMAINVNGPFYLCQAALPHLLSTSGSIVNVASNAAIRGQAYTVAYATSKAALMNMTRSLAMEYINQPVRINAVLPGGMNTEMARGASLPEGLELPLINRFMGLRPHSEPEDVARFIVYVASDQSISLHGAALVIDGAASTG
jgi:NAD(P)-dependent dehydrogenase (short-subunit alcohol dehydrogenase family)